MPFLRKLIRRGLKLLAALTLFGAIAVTATYFYVSPQLPSVTVLKDIRFQVPLQVYTQEGLLLAEYGSKKRDPLSYDQVPPTMIHAILASEDDRFFQHPGVDYHGILRAVYQLIKTGEKAQGGSTITMQVARNFFLSSEKTYLRKINEIFLAFRIELELTKEQILELYLNKIYLGNRAYGVGSAAQIYYGKSLAELNLAQTAMIAGLPKAPSRYNPIADPDRAIVRRNYVLQRMLDLGYISLAEYTLAKNEPVTANLHKAAIDIDAPYIGEMVRDHLYSLYGENAYTDGYKVFVTIKPQLQAKAQEALRSALLDYDRRHGYRGPIEQIEITAETELESVLTRLKSLDSIGNLKPALIFQVDEQTALALLDNGKQILLPWEGLSWAAPYIDTNTKGAAPVIAADVVRIGDVVYVQEISPGSWQLGQLPNVAGALVSLDPKDGAIIALAGGFDFFHSKFNRATQAKRQPGSSFKPFIYSAALEKGFTAASIINDAPVVFDDPGLEASWRPENYSGRVYGPTRLREALVNSRNLVSIRLLQSIGINYAIDYTSQFGFDRQRLPRDLSLSLGSAAVTPLELASAYTTFANGGFKVSPYFIQRIENSQGEIIFKANPAIACPECEDQPTAPITTSEAIDTIAEQPITPPLAPRVITKENAYLMTSMMRDVIRRGTGRRALQLRRNDLAGKTGTTNDQRDAWFSGFNSNIVTISWTGFDDAQPLGNNETGGRAALPMWVDYMALALKDMPETPLAQPAGLVTVRIDPKTGLLAGANQKDAIFEIFRKESVPEKRAADIDESVTTPDSEGNTDSSPQLLF